MSSVLRKLKVKGITFGSKDEVSTQMSSDFSTNLDYILGIEPEIEIPKHVHGILV